jgi:hypothetical protein
MKKATTLVLQEEELLELLRILDDDAPAALEFLRRHLRAKAHQLLEGG